MFRIFVRQLTFSGQVRVWKLETAGLSSLIYKYGKCNHFVWPKQQFCSPHVRLMHSGDTLTGASYRHNRAAEPLCTQV